MILSIKILNMRMVKIYSDLFVITICFLEEWNETEIHAFEQALEKFNHDWTQIAEYVHRSEESCRAFYIKKQRKNISPSDDHVKKSLHF